VIAIPLTQGKVALIDDRDAHLAAHKWYAKRDCRAWYAARGARRGGKLREFRLHREVLGITDPDVEVDHVNGNGLDNRRANLRIATAQQNQANRSAQANNASGLKGVSWHKRDRKWRAHIRIAGKQHSLGYYATREEAAGAYDVAAVEAHGEFARRNFAAPFAPPSTATPAPADTTGKEETR